MTRELRATFNGGLGMVAVAAAGGRGDRDRRPSRTMASPPWSSARSSTRRRSAAPATSRGRWRRRVSRTGSRRVGRADRGRRLGGRIEPAGAARRGGARRARRRDRPGLRRSAVPGARLGGGAGHRHRARRQAATTRRSRTSLVAVRAGRRRPRRATCASSGPAVLAAYRGADPQHASQPPAGVPRRARGPRRARARRRP